MSHMMFVLPGVIALVVGWWVTRCLCSPKSWLLILDHPNDRTLHQIPTPRNGGFAIVAGVLLSLLVAACVVLISRPSEPFLPKGLASGSLWIVGSMFLVFLVSFIDDIVDLSAGIRLVAQAAAALIVISGIGLTISYIPIPYGQGIQFGWMAGPLSGLFLLWMANLYNFMDGMDGFAGGMTVIGFGFLAYFGWKAGSPVMLLIATVVAMSALGFLIHNFPPARIFMGDAGSITVGFLAGTLIVFGVRSKMFDLWAPIIVFSPFILDATVTLIRRALRFEKVWEAHREHYYQRVVLAGWSHRRTVLTEYGIMVLCGGLAILYENVSDGWQWVILVTWLVMFLLLEAMVSKLEQRCVNKGLTSAQS